MGFSGTAPSRNEKILRHIDVGALTGVEIGPLDRPIISRSAGRILYLDHHDTEGLKQKYAAHAADGLVSPDDLAEVDLVADGRRFADILGTKGPIDYVVASHVIEHIPDPVGWLCDLAEGLRDGGLVSLVIPDRRFTFDRFRRPSNAGDLIDAFLQRRTVATAGQVFDYFANVCMVESSAIWNGAQPERVPVPGHTPATALQLARQLGRGTAVPDVHCSVFAVAEFADVLRQIIMLDLLPYEVVALEPPSFGEAEFFVTLRKSAAPAKRRAASVPKIVWASPTPEAERTAIVISYKVPAWIKNLVPGNLKDWLRSRFLRQI